MKCDKNIVLTGMSGAGKSTLGVVLAKTLGMDYLDTDILIQNREHMRLQELLDACGPELFIQKEAEIVSALDVRRCVIATGGSVVYAEKTMQALRRSGLVIFLDVPFEEISQRISNIETRGIVLRQGRSLRDAYEERMPLYRKYSDITIECSGKNVEECIREIIDKAAHNELKGR